jgi:hypothetical protein
MPTVRVALPMASALLVRPGLAELAVILVLLLVPAGLALLVALIARLAPTED